MANKSFVIQYLIKARDQFTAPADDSARSVSKLTKAVRLMNKVAAKSARKLAAGARGFKKWRQEATQARDATSSVTGKLKELAAGAAAFFTVQSFFEKGMAFETALADLSAITGSTGKELAFLKDESLRLGSAMIVSQDQVANAFKIVASAKSELLEDPKGLSKVTEQVLLLANAARIDLTSAAEVTTQAMNQFGVGASEASRFVNVLAAGSKIGASEVAETGTAIIKAGAVAKAVGVNFETLNAAIQVLAKGGVKAEVAGTGLKTALLAMEKLPASMRPSVVGLGEALETLGEKQLSVGQMQKIFGSEAVVIGQILSENAGLVKEWTGALTGTNIAQEQAAKNSATFGKRLEKINVLISGALIKAFLKMEPMLTKNAEAFASWLENIDEDKIRGFVGVLTALGEVLSFIAGIVGVVMEGLGAVGKVFGEGLAAVITGDFSQFSAGTLTTPAPPPPQAVEVGVNVGLDAGLTQTGAATFNGAGARRADVGAM